MNCSIPALQIPGFPMLTFRHTLTAVLGLALGSTLSWGVEINPLPSDINTTVPGHPDLVYLDLLRQLVPDLQPNETIASGMQIEPVRHVMGPFMGSNGFSQLPEPITFGSFQTRFGTFEGQQHLLVLARLGGGDGIETPTLLLAFTDEDKPKLADVLDVAFADIVTFGTPQPVSIGPNDQAVFATSHSRQGDVTELTDVMLFMQDGKLEPFGMLARTEKTGCGFQWTQPVSVTAQKPATPGPYDDFVVTITDTGALLDNNCTQSRGEAPFTKAYSALFQWDAKAGTFVADMTELDRLKDVTDARLKP